MNIIFLSPPPLCILRQHILPQSLPALSPLLTRCKPVYPYVGMCSSHIEYLAEYSPVKAPIMFETESGYLKSLIGLLWRGLLLQVTDSKSVLPRR